MNPIYLDYMATTPIDERVLEKMLQCMGVNGAFGNASSTNHVYGWDAKVLVDKARKQVANAIHADENEIIWTSGATESNNLAIKGAALFYQRKGKHIISSKIEHKSVLDSLAYLEKLGFHVTYLSPDRKGRISVDNLKNSLRHDTVLISLMQVNNEIGVIQDIKEISQIAFERGVIFHVDAAQSLGKIPVNVTELGANLISFSGHKIYAPKGIGALYVRRNPRTRLEPLIHGGGHEMGLRSGTLATHQIVGMGEACEIVTLDLAQEAQRILALRERLWEGLKGLGGIFLHGDADYRIPGNLNVGFNGVEGESLMLGLSDLAVSSGAACNSATIEPSYVLKAIGCSSELANSSIRFSIGRYTTLEQIEHTITHVTTVVTRLREISPLDYS